MNSHDDDGSTQRDSQADGPAESSDRNAPASRSAGLPRDQDPVRLTPPADPWLTEAATSAFGDATSSQGFGAATGEPPLADTTPFGAPAPMHGEAPYGHSSFSWEGEPKRRRNHRAKRMIFAVLAACALLLAGMLALDQFGSGDGGDARGVDPSTGATAATPPTGSGQEPTPALPAPAGGVPSADVTTGRQPDSSTDAAAPATSADGDSPEVVYEVTASGSRNTGSVSYTDQDGDIIRRSGIPLPWRTTFPVGAQRKPLVLIAQRKGGGDAGPVTCTITLNGKLLASTTADGKYAAPQCSGSG